MHKHWRLFVCVKVVRGWRQNPQNYNEMPDGWTTMNLPHVPLEDIFSQTKSLFVVQNI